MQQPLDPRSTEAPPQRKYRSKRRAMETGGETPMDLMQLSPPPEPRRAPPPKKHIIAAPAAAAHIAKTEPVSNALNQATEQTRLYYGAQAAWPQKAVDKPALRRKSPLRWLWLLLMVLLLAVTFFWGRNMYREYQAREAERKRIEAEERERAEYPLRYRELIEENAARYGLDPSLVAAVVRWESSFQSDAVSSMGARGLMQLMPETAEWIANALDHAPYSFDQMFDPELNVRFGCWYLSFLADDLDSDPISDPTKMVCGYHAGQGNVKAWLRNPKYSSDGVTLDVIPDEDTARYASKVLSAQRMYVKHYFSGQEAPAAPSSANGALPGDGLLPINPLPTPDASAMAAR